MKNIGLYFFDASAVIKIFVAEPGSERVNKIMGSIDPIFSSWVILAEVLGVLKRKYLIDKNLSDAEYSQAIDRFFKMIKSRKIRVLDLTEENGEPALSTFTGDIATIRKQYPYLDAADALQIAAMDNSILKLLQKNGSTFFVTADNKLGKAAEEKGYEVLYVNS